MSPKKRNARASARKPKAIEYTVRLTEAQVAAIMQALRWAGHYSDEDNGFSAEVIDSIRRKLQAARANLGRPYEMTPAMLESLKLAEEALDCAANGDCEQVDTMNEPPCGDCQSCIARVALSAIRKARGKP